MFIGSYEQMREVALRIRKAVEEEGGWRVKIELENWGNRPLSAGQVMVVALDSEAEIELDRDQVDTMVGSDCVLSQTDATGARIGDRCRVGPFAHLPEGADLPSDTVTGAFYTPG